MEEVADDDGAITASALNRQTAARMFDLVERARERLAARFIGGSADDHELSTRTATHALLSLQESVSSIGAHLVGHVTAKGRIPAAILAATELRLSPNVLPGSVVFELSRPTGTEDMLAEGSDRALLDESFDKLFELLASVAAPNADPGTVPSVMKELGPRAAKHIFDLCATLVDDSLGLDFEWVNREGKPKAAHLTNGHARYLKEVAKKSTSASKTIDLAGVLLTASVDSKQKLKLRDANGETVAMTAADDLRASLATFYNREVWVQIVQTESVSIATGKATVTNRLISIDLGR